MTASPAFGARIQFRHVKNWLCLICVLRWSGDPPGPAEIFTVVRVSETKVALKSGYGRYVGVNTAGELTGKAEAVGPREIWEPVFEEVNIYSMATHHAAPFLLCFLTYPLLFPPPSSPSSSPSSPLSSPIHMQHYFLYLPLPK